MTEPDTSFKHRIKCFFEFHEWKDWYFHFVNQITGAGMTSYEKTTCIRCGKLGKLND